jgi:hypothetical protein
MEGETPTPSKTLHEALKKMDPPAVDSTSQVTGLEDLPEAAPPLVQMKDDEQTPFKLFLRSHGWHPRGEQKKNIAAAATCDCCLITCCILSCNCCCGKYGSFQCAYCHDSCNCLTKNDYWD